MEIKISKWAIFWKSLWGGKEAVFDYLLDLGNSAVAQLSGASKEGVERAYANIGKVRQAIGCLEWMVPANWYACYAAVIRCFDALYDALADGQVTRPELDGLVKEFQCAYAMWRAE